jgi:PAS domain S-box-containing protein
VAQGDFHRLEQAPVKDELGMLTAMFNQMTSQLSEARQDSEQRQRQVESAKAYLESVLERLSSGVLSTDAQFRVRSVNQSALQILAFSGARMQDLTLAEIADKQPLLRSFVQTIVQACNQAGGAEWRRQIERMSKSGNQVLLLRGAKLSATEDEGHVIVFDDISHLLQTERQAAWGEIARRLAHEIKNPLTPIQLSAERLSHKLSDKLDEDDAQLLQRATRTIVNQVGALKNMVAEFADYARSPALKLVEVDMYVLLQEVLDLYHGNQVAIKLGLHAGAHRVMGDATRLRQVLHNLLQNALDAVQELEQPEIRIGSAGTLDTLEIWVQDNGAGIPESLLTRAFDPYVTTKIKGTGLGLAIAKKIVEEHGGSIAISNIAPSGTRVDFILPLLKENL